VRAGFHIADTSGTISPSYPLPIQKHSRYSLVAQKDTHIQRYAAWPTSSLLLLLQRQLRCLGHVIRMPSNRLPRRLLYGELLLGQRSVGRQKLRYSDHVKSVLRKCNNAEADLEVLAADRELWSSTCATGLKSFKAASEQADSDRRARRHAAAAATPVGPVCHHCGKICASYFGLRTVRSHIRVHLRPHN